MIETDFAVARIPALVQGVGALSALPGRVKRQGYTRAVIITGGRSLDRSGTWERIAREFQGASVLPMRFPCADEPSPATVDSIVEQVHQEVSPLEPAVVIGIGGGSVLDTAKAVAALLGEWRLLDATPSDATPYPSVRSFLEGVGDRLPSGVRLPLIAVPTTSGTGSEATKNAAISEIGPQGFKKSLRHDSYVPDMAVLDPLMMVSCPPEVTAASGLDALTQLIESYVSSAASPFTDLIALEGIRIAAQALPKAFHDGRDLVARADMAYAAYLSGISLANANLGVIHGAAGVLGARVPIPHGIACGTLLAEATRSIIEQILKEYGEDSVPFRKYLAAAQMFVVDKKVKNVKEIVTLFLDQLFVWQEQMNIPRLGTFGLSRDDIHEAAIKTGLKKTPVVLDASHIEEIFAARL